VTLQGTLGQPGITIPVVGTSYAIVVGSHLDSVPAGPGINDNGSGTATDLETAIQIAKLGLKPRRALRFVLLGRRG
jgi:Zn-dependent M28 family amino/carboxypeptidase